jgi:spore coat polysaccharide biosynthesis protein SpsF (cytidylyltransferase family)
MAIKRAIIQASSRSWSGGADDSVAIFNEEPLFVHTARRMKRAGIDSITVAAPAFDKDGTLGEHVDESGLDNTRVIHAHDASPLRRCVAACEDLADNDLVLRINGANFTLPSILLERAMDAAEAGRTDLIKLPDDYPGPFQFEISRLGALRAAARALDQSSPLNIHPRFAVLRANGRANGVSAEESEVLTDLVRTRSCLYKLLENRTYLEVNTAKSIPIGDQLSFHYTLALSYMIRPGSVLDLGCGPGDGSMRLVKSGFDVTGGDIEA